ncbi:MAG: ferrous iron transport protein B [Clostridiales bacterium]|jgi:ferrous iron transport protein B|nr:ferrous iron transport protein B [Clostridiales bacterium]
MSCEYCEDAKTKKSEGGRAKTSARVIALLGQPNSGKSTLFNTLTGGRQHVGNWPGKTVEKKDGAFKHKGRQYIAADLPGSYSLSAGSEEEIVTRDYIAGGDADVVCILADASQLERSLYMLADFAPLNVPAILLLNMMDVAKEKGIAVDAKLLEERLGIPVVPFVASDPKSYGAFYDALENAGTVIRTPPVFPETAASSTGKPAEPDVLAVADIKFKWIETLLEGAVKKTKESAAAFSRFDRIATSNISGKLLAIAIGIVGLIAAMIPFFAIGGAATLLPSLLGPPAAAFLQNLGLGAFLTSLVVGSVLNTFVFAIGMAAFVFGITFVFGLLEDVGYMARVSFVFDGVMSKLGLQGKAIMPFFVSLGCTIGGTAGTRVIDTWGQRVLAMALLWAVPCAAILSVIPILANIFFGWGTLFVMLGVFAVMALHIMITAKVFGRSLVPEKERIGMIMELPPYHKPKWGLIFKAMLLRSKDIFLRAYKVVFVITVLFFCLTWTADGNAENSVIYKAGHLIDPVARFFGLSWQLFMAFIAAAFAKEAVLGVLSALYLGSGNIFESAVSKSTETAANFGAVLAEAVSKPEALAFIFAVSFTVPCVSALVSTYLENHSLKWTLRIAGYYVATALLLSLVVFRVSSLFF